MLTRGLIFTRIKLGALKIKNKISITKLSKGINPCQEVNILLQI